MPNSSITQSLLQYQTQIQNYELKYHRSPNSVTLLAVSKGQPLEKLQAAIDAGQTQFGENYLQEALNKINSLQHYPQLEWHFIGSIQSNKTRQISEHFSWVHTVCSEKIAQRLNDQRPPALPPLNICLEINVSQEPTKSGLRTSEEILALAKFCSSLPQLRLRGLMTIPAPKNSFSEQREEFHKLYELQQTLIKQAFPLDTLSMGMTEDLEAAIAEGSTLVRLGRGIFGNR